MNNNEFNFSISSNRFLKEEKMSREIHIEKEIEDIVVSKLKVKKNL